MKEQIEAITYEQDRLNYFTDLMKKTQERYKRLFKKHKDAPYLSEEAQALSDAGRETHFLGDVVGMLEKGDRKQSEWISVEDRLPESQVMVIGYTPCDGYMFVGFYQKVDSPYLKSYWNVITAMRSTRKMTKKVTHWMPLPEPPEMKGGE